MNIVIIGAGRMGLRHVTGCLDANEVNKVLLLDISDESVANAKTQLSTNVNKSKLEIGNINAVKRIDSDVVIIATTAANRIETAKIASEFNPKYILIEKPLGQSFQEVEELKTSFATSSAIVCVNLNMRLYPFIIQLKKDLQEWEQFLGPKTITFNGGSLGIGANGIHYLDLLYYLFDAQTAKIISGGIDDTLIPSGRGVQFGDYGGWVAIEYFEGNERYLGKAIISLSSTSTVFGGWDIVGTHARIRINEIEASRVNIVRKADSDMPINRYAADYLPAETVSIETPHLADLTKEWISNLANGVNILPSLEESIKVHHLLFEWLSLSRVDSEKFPIT